MTRNEIGAERVLCIANSRGYSGTCLITPWWPEREPTKNTRLHILLQHTTIGSIYGMGGTDSHRFLSLTRLRGLRHSKITQFSAREIIQPAMNMDIAPFQCVLDRIRLGEVLKLLSHILPHQERKRFRLIQRINLERSSEVGERR